MRENKGRPDVLSSFDAAPSKLGNVPYLDPSSAAPRNTQGKAEEGLSIVNKTRCTPEVTERQGTFTALWSRFHPTKRTRKKVSHFDLSTVFRQRELRSHNGKEGQVLYGILVMSKCLSGSGPKDKSILFCEAHYCDPASAALVFRRRSK